MEAMRLQEKFPILLELRGLKQADVARLTGIDPGAVSRIKTGEWTPPIEKALRLARALGVSVDYLIDPDQDDPPPPLLSEDEADVLRTMRDYALTREEAKQGLAMAFAAKRSGGVATATADPDPADLVPASPRYYRAVADIDTTAATLDRMAREREARRPKKPEPKPAEAKPKKE